MSVYTSILLAIDGSKNSLRATEEACKIASTYAHASITMIYVIDYDQSKNDILHTKGKSELELTRRLKLLPAEEYIQGRNIPFKVCVVHGDPGPTIVDYANNNQYDLLIIGSRGLNLFQEMVLGSVSHKVVKRAKCPVLVVK